MKGTVHRVSPGMLIKRRKPGPTYGYGMNKGQYYLYYLTDVQDPRHVYYVKDDALLFVVATNGDASTADVMVLDAPWQGRLGRVFTSAIEVVNVG